MLYRDVITLISETSTLNANGYDVIKETTSDVFADVQSVTRTEFYESMKAGISLACAFVVRCADYAGQKLIEFNGTRYKVERTYSYDGETVELNCSEVIR